MSTLTGLWWLLLLVGPLLILQRRLHLEIQAVFYLVTRRLDFSLVLFSLLFFPGVLLHEGSHYIVAHLLGVRTGRFSLLPQPMPNGRLRMGYVEAARTDVIRDALIGAAPMFVGGVFVAYAGIAQLQLSEIWEALTQGGLAALSVAVGELLAKDDIWLWFYLVFVVSSTMLPSQTDRRAWIPVLVITILLLSISLLAGAGDWMLVNLAPLVNKGLIAAAIICAISLSVHLLLLGPVYLLRSLISRLTGYKVV